ncbi:hypothetical protein [Waterburya agarophytonicola]|uniref:hypothetical protein n=1 Tax=Waterburya agarophytonicola TaxID=2886916 RepID=UPI001E495C95|nr:hypothetical protein [Waterburya agarophytonicola]
MIDAPTGKTALAFSTPVLSVNLVTDYFPISCGLIIVNVAIFAYIEWILIDN